MRKTKWRLTTLVFFCLAFSGCDTNHDVVLRPATVKDVLPVKGETNPKQTSYLYKAHDFASEP